MHIIDRVKQICGPPKPKSDFDSSPMQLFHVVTEEQGMECAIKSTQLSEFSSDVGIPRRIFSLLWDRLDIFKYLGTIVDVHQKYPSNPVWSTFVVIGYGPLGRKKKPSLRSGVKILEL